MNILNVTMVLIDKNFYIIIENKVVYIKNIVIDTYVKNINGQYIM